MMLQQDEPDDFVIASNNSVTVEDFLDLVFKKVDLDYKNHLVIDQKFFRPHDVPYLRGDSSKAQKTLNWKPEIDLERLASLMIESDLKDNK